MSRITVVIPTFQAADDLPECLDALERQTYRDFDVLVVDGRSPDGTADVARARGARVVADEGKTRAHACEEALLHVTSDLVAFTDADCIPEPSWLDELVRSLEAAPPEYASAGGPNVSPAGDSALGKAVDVVYGTRLMSGGTRYGFQSDHDVEINHNPGCNVLYRADDLRAVGFEEFPTAEDVVVDHRIRVMGGKLLFNPRALVRHKRRGTLRGFLRQLRRYGKGRALAARKYHRLWQPVYPLPSAGLLVAAALLLAGAWEVAATGRARLLGVLGGLVLAYAGVVALDVASSRSPHLSPSRGLLATLLIPLGQAAWAVGYLEGSFARHPAFLSPRQGLLRDVAFLAASAGVGLAAFFTIA